MSNENNISEKFNFNQRLRDLALQQQVLQPRIDELKAVEAKLKALRVALEEDLENAEKAIRTDALEWVNATGDLTIHESLTFRRTTKWVYDSDDALAWAKEHGLESVVRVKESLDVRTFEKSLENGDIVYSGAEKVASPTIAIGKLGHLLMVGSGNNE